MYFSSVVPIVQKRQKIHRKNTSNSHEYNSTTGLILASIQTCLRWDSIVWYYFNTQSLKDSSTKLLLPAWISSTNSFHIFLCEIGVDVIFSFYLFLQFFISLLIYFEHPNAKWKLTVHAFFINKYLSNLFKQRSKLFYH